MSCHLTFCTIGTNTNPFTSKWRTVLGSEKNSTLQKKTEKKDTLQRLLGKLWVFILVLSAVGLNPALQDSLILRLVLKVFKVADTLYMPEDIYTRKLLLDVFQ